MWFDWNTTKGTSKALGTTPTGRRSNFRSRTDANQPPSISLETWSGWNCTPNSTRPNLELFPPEARQIITVREQFS